MTNKQVKIFKKLLACNQYTLKSMLAKFLSYNYDTVVEREAYLYAEGNIPICLVAHLDTVHKTPPVDLYYDKAQEVMWSPQGIGADDRAGVFIIMQIIKHGYHPHIIFTTDEEIGCIGASLLAREMDKCPFKECHFIIELDRRGHHDCVFYDFEGKEFEKLIQSYGFKMAIGSYSDICEIAPQWETAAVNLSVGYESEHTLTEILHTDWMYDTLSKVENILKDAREGKTKHYEFKYGRYSGIYRASYYNYIDDDSWFNNKGHKSIKMLPKSNVKVKERGMCYFCLQLFDVDELTPITVDDGYIDYYCPICYKKIKEMYDYNTEVDNKYVV